MKILIVSDTHRKDGNLYDVIEKEKPFDMLIHLGDAEGSEHVIADWLDEDCDLVMVQGNNDFFSSLDREIELDLGPHRAFLTHGHYYNVSLDVDRLWEEAKDRGCDIAMFGHTHRPYLRSWMESRFKSGQSFLSATGGQNAFLHDHGPGR